VFWGAIPLTKKPPAKGQGLKDTQIGIWELYIQYGWPRFDEVLTPCAEKTVELVPFFIRQMFAHLPFFLSKI
jgi:hypothetical protein